MGANPNTSVDPAAAVRAAGALAEALAELPALREAGVPVVWQGARDCLPRVRAALAAPAGICALVTLDSVENGQPWCEFRVRVAVTERPALNRARPRWLDAAGAASACAAALNGAGLFFERMDCRADGAAENLTFTAAALFRGFAAV